MTVIIVKMLELYVKVAISHIDLLRPAINSVLCFKHLNYDY